MTNEEFSRCIQEAGEKDFTNFQSGIVLLSKMRPILVKYGLKTKEEQDAKIREVAASGRIASPMQYCPAAEAEANLYVDERGSKFDALMLKTGR